MMQKSEMGSAAVPAHIGASTDRQPRSSTFGWRYGPAPAPRSEKTRGGGATSSRSGPQISGRPRRRTPSIESCDRRAGPPRLPEPPRSEPAEAAEGGSPPSPAAVERPAGTAVEDLRLPTRLVANLPNGRVHRGDGLDVRGTLTSVDGTGIAGADVGVWIGPVDAGSGDDEGHRLSRVRTDGEGRFAGTITVPRTLAPGPWAIHVSFAGDDEHLPSHAR